jgi:hypothetical protein
MPTVQFILLYAIVLTIAGADYFTVQLPSSQMILRAMPAVASATGRATLAGQVESDGPDKRGYPGAPGWGLGVRLTTSPCKKNCYETL